MTHLWLLLLFVKPVAINHPYRDPVLPSGYFLTYADCSTLGAHLVQSDGQMDAFACSPVRP